MTPSVPYPGEGGEPSWPPPDPGRARTPRVSPEAQQPDPVSAQQESDREQPTSQLPRHPDTERFPYPAPAGPAPVDRPSGRAVEPSFEPSFQPLVAPSFEPDDQPTDPLDVGGIRAGQPPIRDRGYRPAPRGSHLPPYAEPLGQAAGGRPPAADATAAAPAAAPLTGAGTDIVKTPTGADAGGRRTGPRKLTVTRVAAFRSRELTTRGVQIFQRAAAADGADRSGLTSLTYAVMGNYAVDAALAVALANTLFFAAATAESTGKVLLYLLITVAPFAVIAPLIGPALDKLQHGRRIALAASSFARALLAIVMALNFDSWILYPCALGMLVLSKSFSLLKAAITPRVLPPDITLVKTNSRLTVFGLIAGGVAGALAAALSWAFGSTGALMFTAVLSIAGGLLCLRIPSWVESTAGEIPVDGVGPKAKRAFPLSVTTTLWANGTIRVETGFLALFIAFVIKSEYSESSGFTQLLLLGMVGAAAGVGGFIGNGLGARLPLTKPETVAILSLLATVTATLTAVLIPGLGTAAMVGLVGSTASSLAKVCLDSVIQHELPEASRASAFGLSETVLQLSWVFGGVIGLLIGGVWSFGQDSVFSIGFAVITVLLLIGLAQSWLVRSGRSLLPWLDYSKVSRHFRRSRRGPDGAGAATGPGVAAPRVAGQPAPPPTTAWPTGAAQYPGWQTPPGQWTPPPGQWTPPPGRSTPPPGRSTPQGYGPPSGYGPPTPRTQADGPGYPGGNQESGPPAAAPRPPREAGKPRKGSTP